MRENLVRLRPSSTFVDLRVNGKEKDRLFPTIIIIFF